MNSQPSGAMPPNFSSLNQTAQVAGLSLKRILPEAKPIGGSDLQIQSCCGSWQEIQPNDLYVAIVSADADGHDYAQAAIDRGAVGVAIQSDLGDFPEERDREDTGGIRGGIGPFDEFELGEFSNKR